MQMQTYSAVSQRPKGLPRVTAIVSGFLAVDIQGRADGRPQEVTIPQLRKLLEIAAYARSA